MFLFFFLTNYYYYSDNYLMPEFKIRSTQKNYVFLFFSKK